MVGHKTQQATLLCLFEVTDSNRYIRMLADHVVLKVAHELCLTDTLRCLKDSHVSLHQTQSQIIEGLNTCRNIPSIILLVEDREELVRCIPHVLRCVLLRIAEGIAVGGASTCFEELVGILVLVVRDAVDFVGEECGDLVGYTITTAVCIDGQDDLREAVEPLLCLTLPEFLRGRGRWQRDYRVPLLKHLVGRQRVDLTLSDDHHRGRASVKLIHAEEFVTLEASLCVEVLREGTNLTTTGGVDIGLLLDSAIDRHKGLNVVEVEDVLNDTSDSLLLEAEGFSDSLHRLLLLGIRSERIGFHSPVLE